MKKKTENTQKSFKQLSDDAHTRHGYWLARMQQLINIELGRSKKLKSILVDYSIQREIDSIVDKAYTKVHGESEKVDVASLHFFPDGRLTCVVKKSIVVPEYAHLASSLGIRIGSDKEWLNEHKEWWKKQIMGAFYKDKEGDKK